MAKNKYIGRQFAAANGNIHIAVANRTGEDGKPVYEECGICSLRKGAEESNSDSFRAFKKFEGCNGIHFKLHMVFNPPYKTVFAPSGRYKKGYRGIDNCEICSTCHQSKYQHDWKNTYEGEKLFCPEHYTMVK